MLAPEPVKCLRMAPHNLGADNNENEVIWICIHIPGGEGDEEAEAVEEIQGNRFYIDNISQNDKILHFSNL